MPRAEDERAGTVPLFLGPLAGDEALAFYISQTTFPTTPLDPHETAVKEMYSILWELGAEDALKALRRKAPGPKVGAKDEHYERLYHEAMKASGGKVTAARKRFEDLSELSTDQARKRFSAIHKRSKIKTGSKY
jgi:hypothetical protein